MTRVSASVERSVGVDAAPRQVWAVVADVRQLGDLMPDVERYERVDGGWRWVMVEQRRLGQRFQPRFTVRYELDEPERVRFERVSGAGDSADAGGEITVRGGRAAATDLTFRLDLTVDVPVPSLLTGTVRAMLTDEIRRLADGFLANVRAAAE